LTNPNTIVRSADASARSVGVLQPTLGESWLPRLPRGVAASDHAEDAV